MSIVCKRLWSSLFCLFLLLSPYSARAQDVPASDRKAHAEPQIVRVSYIDGDVRVMRGKKAEKESGNTWEQAQVDLPVEAGFSLVTGKGRAEIEFEDASTAYLGENSVLTFGKLSSKAGVTESELQLIDGTMTVHFVPDPGDSMRVASPTDSFALNYPDKLMLRFNSFVDALGVTPLRRPFTQNLGNGDTVLPVGSMALYRNHQLVPPRMARMNNLAFADLDKWVDQRVRVRAETMAQAMGQSGLDAPLAGLADLEGQGDFFDCAPYGRCWQPTGGWSHGPQEASATQAADPHTVSVAALQSGASPKVQAPSSGAGPALFPEDTEDYYFPCGPREAYVRWLDPYQQLYPWNWVVCHSGSWIHRPNGYAWVVQKRRHHHWPVRWVKVNGKPAFVPLHPRDAKDKPPINAKYGLFAVNADRAERRERSERLEYNPAVSFKLLDEAPKDFRRATFEPLRAAEEPRVEARMSRDASFAGVAVRAIAAPNSHPLITFDHKSQSFVSNRQTMQDGHSVTVRESLGGGPSAARGASTAGGGTARSFGGGGSAGGGSRGGGGGFSGGGSHAGGGGGGASAGWASHGGGGGSAGGGGGSHPGH